MAVIVCALISTGFLYLLAEIRLKGRQAGWKYIWLVLGLCYVVLLPHRFLSIYRYGGSSLDVHFRDTIDGKLQKSGLLLPQIQPGKALDPVTHAVEDSNRVYVSFRDALHSELRKVANQKGVACEGAILMAITPF